MDSSYDEHQIKAIVQGSGVEIVGETSSNFLCFCPFHTNTASPAFSVDKESGLWLCFNEACQGSRGGNLLRLVMSQTGKNEFEALRFVAKKAGESRLPLRAKIDKYFFKERMPIYPQIKIDEHKSNLNARAINYLKSRGFTKETCDYFEVGYNPEHDTIVVPIHDKDGNPVGVNERSVEGKRFYLTPGVPRNKLLFNLHRARGKGGTIIVCESQFDAMRIHQAGFPNVVAQFGSHVSKEQVSYLVSFFDRLILMHDNDDAGVSSANRLPALVRGLKVEWALYDWEERFPNGAKDAGDMTDEDIAKCIHNSVPDLAYRSYHNIN